MRSVTVARWRDLDIWTPAYTTDKTSIWPLVAVEDVLRPSEVEAYRPAPDETIQLAGVRWYGGGLFIREARIGSELTGRCLPLVPGNLVYNRLFAWKSAFALVGDEFAGVMVSTEFPQFELNRERIIPEFAWLLCASGPFAQQILVRSSGTTAVSRNRLREVDFLRLTFPLPPRGDQQRLVAEHAGLRSEADALDALATSREVRAWQRFEEDLGFPPSVPVTTASKVSVSWFADLSRWNPDSAESDITSSGRWPVALLSQHADIRLGTQLTRRGITSGTRHPYLRAVNIRRGHVDLSDVKFMRVVDSMAEALTLAEGDLLFVEGNSREEVGRCGIWTGDPGDYIYQNSVIRARINSRNLDPKYACAWFSSALGRRYFEQHATTTTGTLWHIGAGKTARASIPLPPISIQEEMAATLWDEVVQASLEKRRATEIRLRSDAAFNVAVFGEDVPRQ